MVLDSLNKSETNHQKWLSKWFQVLRHKGLTAKGLRILAITRQQTTDLEKLGFVEKLRPISRDIINLAEMQRKATAKSAVKADVGTVVAGFPVEVGPQAGTNKKIEDAILKLPGTLSDRIDEILNDVEDSSAPDLRTLLSVMISAAELLTTRGDECSSQPIPRRDAWREFQG